MAEFDKWCGSHESHPPHVWTEFENSKVCPGFLIMQEVARFADVAMFTAKPIEPEENGEILPKVTLISLTPDPIRTMAAACGLYSGKIIRSREEVSREEAEHWLSEMSRTALKAGLEFVDFHFLIENVSRGFTHQLVRQRTAVYVQESMRFAVKENAGMEVGMPPSIARLAEDHPQRVVWQKSVERMGQDYMALIESGIPAEDARGLLPTNILTRVHYKTNLRGLMEHAGMRLCTQAQFEWRLVWAEILRAIRAYPDESEPSRLGPWFDLSWQCELLANLFRPICYRTGKCEFAADIDRACSIRSRVNAHHAAAEPSTTWVDILPREWMADPTAARVAPGEEML
jgi:flavin-dependent thymidylate synthase